MDADDSPVDSLLAVVQSALMARRGALNERVQAIERALVAYRRAAEAQIAREFAEEHGFKHPSPAALSPERAAELLRAAVSGLPELFREQEEDLDPTRPPQLQEKIESSVPRPAPHAFQPGAKIVVIGALSGRDKTQAVPEPFGDSIEWVDTERQGSHAIGNLPQRLRQRRVDGVIILERAVKHRHTEPVMAAAREARVPIAFAGQGGRASLLRAFAEIDRALKRPGSQ